MKVLADKLLIIVLFCLTLGLAPFSPEPHIVEKIKWVSRGAEGMVWYDWFDLFLHGTPWVLLVLAIIGKFLPSKAKA